MARVGLFDAAGVRFKDNRFGTEVLAGKNPFGVDDEESTTSYTHGRHVVAEITLSTVSAAMSAIAPEVEYRPGIGQSPLLVGNR